MMAGGRGWGMGGRGSKQVGIENKLLQQRGERAMDNSSRGSLNDGKGK